MAGPTTPRDRVVDLLRAGSILVVVLGHWLMAVVTWGTGQVATANLLSLVPALQPATWLLQVMPVFFVVGGFANAGSWDSVRRRGGTYADFVRHRVGRLLRPVWPLLGLWVIAAGALAVRGHSTDAMRAAMLVAVQPLWFVSLYILVLACTPFMLALHRRHGVRVLVALALLVAGVDALRLGASLAVVGYLNYALAWLFAHQLGFFHSPGRRPQAAPLVAVALGAVAALVLLTGPGPYPVSMVGLEGQLSNLAPPTLCIVVLTTGQVAGLLLAAPLLHRLAERPEVWRAVVATSSVIMTVFLWHLTALVLVALAASALGLPMPAATSAAWWALRPLWLAALAAVLAVLVLLTGRFERAGLGRRGPVVGRGRPATVAASLGVVWLVLGLAGLALCGLDGLWLGQRVALLHLTMDPVVSLVDTALGALLVEAAVRGRGYGPLALAAGAFAVLAVLEALPGGLLTLPPRTGASGVVSYLLTAVLLLGALVTGRGQPRVRSRRSATCGDTAGSSPRPMAR